jgi:hypothetical protein
MDLHDVASPFVQPGDHEELVAGGDSKQRVGCPRLDVEPRVGRALVCLARPRSCEPSVRI